MATSLGLGLDQCTYVIGGFLNLAAGCSCEKVGMGMVGTSMGVGLQV